MAIEREVQRIGRLVSWTDAEAQKVVDAWRRSGESKAAFGRRYGIAVHRLYFWIAKFGGNGPAPLKKPRKEVRFHPVRVVGDETATAKSPTESIEVPRNMTVDELRAVFTAIGV